MQSQLEVTERKEMNLDSESISKFKSIKDVLGCLTQDKQQIFDALEPFNGCPVTYNVHFQNQQVGNLCKDEYDCSKCLNKGFYYVIVDDLYKHEAMTPCHCQKIRAALKQSEKSGLGDMRKHRLNNYLITESWQQEMRDLAKDYILEAIDQWLLLFGQSGTGKTHLSSAVCNKRLEDGYEVLYTPWRDYIDKVKDYKTSSYERENHYQQMVMNTQILYIDDLFKGKITDADKSYAFELINYRYTKKLVTIISSEMSITQIAREVDEAVAGRLKEMAGKYYFQINKDIKKNYRFKEDKVT